MARSPIKARRSQDRYLLGADSHLTSFWARGACSDLYGTHRSTPGVKSQLIFRWRLRAAGGERRQAG